MHDIGKFTERAKNENVDDRYNKVKMGHPKYSAQLLKVLSEKNNFFNQKNKKIIEAVLYHHEPKNMVQKIVQLADWLSSTEGEENNETKEVYYEIPLKSIFPKIFSKEDQSYYYDLSPLNLENLDELIPQKDVTVNSHVLTLPLFAGH